MLFVNPNTKIIFSYLVFFVVYCVTTNAQNIIPNGSFEEFTKDTFQYECRKVENLKYWKHFSTDSMIEKPRIFVGNRLLIKKKANQDGFVTLYFRNFERTKKEELCKIVFMTQLKQKLKTNAFYRFSYYLRIHPLGDHHNDTINPQLIKFFIRKEKLSHKGEIDSLQKEEHAGMLPKLKKYRSYDKKGFRYNSFDYKANGEEKYFIFGIIDTIYSKIKTYFEFENICLVEVSEKPLNIKKLLKGDTLILENILFETNKAVLKSSSFATLNRLGEELKQHQNLKVKISGHTDNKGIIEKNLELSEQRAKVVANYIKRLGISSERLAYIVLVRKLCV